MHTLLELELAHKLKTGQAEQEQLLARCAYQNVLETTLCDNEFCDRHLLDRQRALVFGLVVDKALFAVVEVDLHLVLFIRQQDRVVRFAWYRYDVNRDRAVHL